MLYKHCARHPHIVDDCQYWYRDHAIFVNATSDGYWMAEHRRYDAWYVVLRAIARRKGDAVGLVRDLARYSVEHGE